jgi:hypothetical protein
MLVTVIFSDCVPVIQLFENGDVLLFFNHKMLVGLNNPREKSYRMLDAICRIESETHPIAYSPSSSALKDFVAGDSFMVLNVRSWSMHCNRLLT